MAKIDNIRCFAENIAQWRVDGLTWAQVATKLAEEGIGVGTDEIRSYWPRLSEGQNPAEYLLYWQSSQRNAEAREARKRAEAAEAEIVALRQEIEQQTQSGRLQDPLQAECGQLREQLVRAQAQWAESRRARSDLDQLLDQLRRQHRDDTDKIRHLLGQIDELTERAGTAETLILALQQDIAEANARIQAANAEIHRSHQRASELERLLAEAEARTAKAVAENEVYGNIRYYMGKGEGQAQLDEMNKTLNGWIRFGESLSQAHQAGNKAEVASLLNRVVTWAASRGKA
ncbi:MAG: hypothetical protein ACM3Q1_01800 [Bacteroidales bacterium]